jgi:hypothetical protein
MTYEILHSVIYQRYNEKENVLKKLSKQCLHCGSGAIRTVTDEVKPVFKMEVTHYACGAVMKNMSGARGQLGRLSHEGCCSPEAAEANL